MSGKRRMTGQPGRMAFCALLSLWICVIMYRESAILPVFHEGSFDRTGPVLVIDPGHGGLDGGAVSVNGKPESGYNLSIALRLRDMGALLGIPTVLTRETESLDYPAEYTTIAARKRWDTRRRVEQINALPGSVLISIHQNFYPSESPRGVQILYADNEDSRFLAEGLQERFRAFLEPENRRLAQPANPDIYLLSHVHVPAVLVECGFLSNPKEAEKLDTPEHQIRLAAVLADGFLRFTEEKDP